MAENWFTGFPLQALSPESVHRIHAEVIALLERVGVEVNCEEALWLLSDNGVRCDLDRKRAYPDENHLQRALSTVRKSYDLHSRKPGPSAPLHICDTSTHVISGGAALRMFADGAYETATEEDLINMTVLHERLEHIDIIINVAEPLDVDKDFLYPVMAADLFCYTSKPLLLQVGSRKDLQKILRMAVMIAGSEANLRARPLFMTGINAEPPLRIPREAAEILMDAARAGIPVSLGDYPMLGSTGPLHVIGSLIQRTATVLAGLALTQATQPGSVYDFTCHSGGCDLRNGGAVTMSSQVMQMVAASVQIGRRYGLITHALACTEARSPDAQAAAERASSLMASVLSGASLIHHGTSCMAGMELADYAQCVVDNEIVGQALAFATGIPMAGLDKALTVIREVAADASNSGLYFLAHPHTAAHCREAAAEQQVFESGPLSPWLSGKRETIYEKAGQIARRLTASREEFVPQGLKAELFRIAREV